MEGVGRGRNGEIVGDTEKQQGCVYVCEREKSGGKVARKTEKQLVVVEGN